MTTKQRQTRDPRIVSTYGDLRLPVVLARDLKVGDYLGRGLQVREVFVRKESVSVEVEHPQSLAPSIMEFTPTSKAVLFNV